MSEHQLPRQIFIRKDGTGQPLYFKGLMSYDGNENPLTPYYSEKTTKDAIRLAWEAGREAAINQIEHVQRYYQDASQDALDNEDKDRSKVQGDRSNVLQDVIDDIRSLTTPHD